MIIKYNKQDIPFIIDMLYIILKDEWSYYEEISINDFKFSKINELKNEDFLYILNNTLDKYDIITINGVDVKYIFSLTFYIISDEKHDDYYLLETLKKIEK